MSFTNRRIAAGMLFVLILAALARYGGASAQTNGGRLRLVHAVPGAPAADISIDNVVAARGLAFASATRYLMVAPGDHSIAVSAGGNTVFQGKVTVNAAQALTVVLQGTPTSVQSAVYEDDLGPTAPGNVRLTAVQAISDAPAVDILRGDSSPLIQGLKFGAPYGGFDIPATALSAVVIPTGGDVSKALLKTDSLPLVAGTYNVLVLVGTASGQVKPSYVLLSAPTDVDKPSSEVFVRFVHAATGAKPVDVYVGGKLAAPGLAFGNATPHVAVDATAADVVVRTAGSAADSAKLASFSLSGPAALAGGAAGTLVIGGTDGNLTLQLSPDNIGTLDPKTTRVNLINAAGGSATLKIGGKSLVSGSKATSSDLPAGIYDATVNVDKPAIQLSSTLPLSGGVLYDVVVAGNDQSNQLIIGATGLNEQVVSAPAANPVAVAQANTSAPAATTAATAAPTEAPVLATQPASAPTATPSPTLVSQPPPATEAATEAPPAATEQAAPSNTPAPQQPATPGIVGVVNVNEGVNLKIREYPRTDARTLALVPSQGTLDVQGVRGAASTGSPTASNITPTKGPTPTLSVTGVTVDSIWLYVVWTVPTGGTVSGWVNAQYVDLTRNGKPVRDVQAILSFKVVSADTPGEVNSSAVTPIAQTSQVLGVVTVDEGRNLQMRRTPDVNGESLALIPANAQIIVLQQVTIGAQGTPVPQPTPAASGTPIPTANAGGTLWLFVRYQTDSGAADGWVNAQFVKMTKNGRKADLTLDVPVATEITRGFLEGNSAGPATQAPPPGVIATVDKLNQGANLQLRQNPDATSESLGLIPSGSELQVEGRNEDGNWLKVKFNDLEGWINSQFVTLTKNGRAYKVQDVTNLSGKPDTIAISTPGPSPTGTVKVAPNAVASATVTATPHP